MPRHPAVPQYSAEEEHLEALRIKRELIRLERILGELSPADALKAAVFAAIFKAEFEPEDIYQIGSRIKQQRAENNEQQHNENNNRQAADETVENDTISREEFRKKFKSLLNP